MPTKASWPLTEQGTFWKPASFRICYSNHDNSNTTTQISPPASTNQFHASVFTAVFRALSSAEDLEPYNTISEPSHPNRRRQLLDRPLRFVRPTSSPGLKTCPSSAMGHSPRATQHMPHSLPRTSSSTPHNTHPPTSRATRHPRRLLTAAMAYPPALLITASARPRRQSLGAWESRAG